MAATRAALFDLDNTLTARRASIERFALAFAGDYADRLASVDAPSLQRAFVTADQNGYNPRRAQELCEQLPWKPGEIPPAEELAEYWRARQAYSTLLRDGTIEFLRTLRSAGLRLGIITNGDVDGQQRKLDHHALTLLFDSIVISEAAGCKKPDPRIFARALDELGTEPGETWFIGDHPLFDVAGASACGMRAVWVEADQVWPPDVTEPSYRIRATYPFLSVVRTLLWVEAELIDCMDSLKLMA